MPLSAQSLATFILAAFSWNCRYVESSGHSVGSLSRKILADNLLFSIRTSKMLAVFSVIYASREPARTNTFSFNRLWPVNLAGNCKFICIFIFTSSSSSESINASPTSSSARYHRCRFIAFRATSATNLFGNCRKCDMKAWFFGAFVAKGASCQYLAYRS